MVIDANEVVRQPVRMREQLRISVVVAQSVAFTSAIVAPISGAYLHSWLQWLLTSIFGLIATSAQVYALLAMRRR
jgi:hypothetical protein